MNLNYNLKIVEFAVFFTSNRHQQQRSCALDAGWKDNSKLRLFRSKRPLVSPPVEPEFLNTTKGKPKRIGLLAFNNKKETYGDEKRERWKADGARQCRVRFLSPPPQLRWRSFQLVLFLFAVQRFAQFIILSVISQLNHLQQVIEHQIKCSVSCEFSLCYIHYMVWQ